VGVHALVVNERLYVLLGLLPLLPEVLILVVRPTWLLFVPLWVVAERRFTLRRPRRLENERSYRDAATTALALPPLPERIDFDDAVLFSDGPRLALRRAFQLGRRASWLMRIDVARDGDEITLRTRQVFTPVTIVIAGPLIGWSIGRESVVWMLAFPAIMVAVYLLQIALATNARQAACELAFSRIEAELRAVLEEPRR